MSDSEAESFDEADFASVDGGDIQELGLQEEVQHLDRQAVEFEAAGNLVKAVYLREQALMRRQEMDEPGDEFIDCIHELVVLYNKVAMAALREENTTEALTMLEKAEVLTSAKHLFPSALRRAKLRALTFNNFGCVYKNCEKLHTALKYMDKALKIEAKFDACDNPACTHLNVCAILSKMGRHRGALEHAKFALEILKEERMVKKAEEREAAKEKKLAALRAKRAEEAAASATSKEEDGEEDEEDGTAAALADTGHLDHLTATDTKDGGEGDEAEEEKASMLAIAFYNHGVELEHLKQRARAIKSYQLALKHAEADLGEDNPMTVGIRDMLHKAQQAATKASKRSKGKRAGR